MKSGIYCLTFKDGSCYVGKSIDIERRWKEHSEKLRSGKAAKPMQAAYNNYGFPSARILAECHSDHIDLMETYYICKLQPQLNSIGGIQVDSYELEVLERNSELLTESTAAHLNRIVNISRKLQNLEAKYDSLKEFLDESRMENALGLELNAAEYKLKELEQAQEEMQQKITLMEYDLNKPWWKRIFS